MVHEEIEAFADALPPARAIAGLDLGTATIGVALSDRLLSSATPLETIRRKKFGVDADRLLALLAAREAGGIILGLPRNMDGSEGPRCQSTRAFARNLDASRTFRSGSGTNGSPPSPPNAPCWRRIRRETSRRGDRSRGRCVYPPGSARPHEIFEAGMNKHDSTRQRGEINSPCTKICMIHPEERICVGCLRTLDEIARWTQLPAQERRAIMADLPSRAPRLARRRGGRARRSGPS